MASIEKVIRGLQLCRHKVICQENCKECPYMYDGRAKRQNCEGVLHDDALELITRERKRFYALEKDWERLRVRLNMAEKSIVRCQECVYAEKDGMLTDWSRWCTLHKKVLDADWFCADAKISNKAAPANNKANWEIEHTNWDNEERNG